MSPTNLPARCPSCGEAIVATTLRCRSCETEVHGTFQPCPVCRLEGEARKLFDLFLGARGNLKDVQRALGLSYPTVRQRIDDMFRKLGVGETAAEPTGVLERLRKGEITVAQAERLLRGGPSGAE